ncbi:glycosyltransferase family protein [Photobacterium iliopiscarium]|uniref:hypothetical protein n=1 Tax=Photobacterium iliopiscarium TaxID=56192 RepID=UPI000D1531FA|nr:hypothetical protein [Photobacterium iliopiscarium]PSU01218.1 hypothetical protein C9I85_03430 [Photobacterium iliopiscarium]PSV83871.1 hypothetical protein C9J51_07205 [Photobacterium iliopiscarium]
MEINKKALLISGVSWDATWQRHQETAKILSESGYNVDFLESCKTSKLTFSNIFRVLKDKYNKYLDKTSSFNEKLTGVRVIKSKQVPPFVFSKIINKLLMHKYHKDIYNNKYDIIIIYVPVDIALFLKKDNYKYYVFDAIRAFSVWGGYSQALYHNEKAIYDKSDRLLCDSFFIKDVYLKDYTVEHLITPISTISVDKFKNVKKIRTITYFGSVSNHVDIELLNKLSNKYKVLIWGSVDKNINISSNIQYMGYEKDQNKLINSIIEHSDAIIIPYIGNMDGVFPAKLIISLYSRLPVFSSTFYDSLKMNDSIYVYIDHSELYCMLENFNDEKFKLKIKSSSLFLDHISYDEYKYKLLKGIN